MVTSNSESPVFNFTTGIMLKSSKRTKSGRSGVTPISKAEKNTIVTQKKAAIFTQYEILKALETAIFRAKQEKQYSAVASNAKVIMILIFLAAKIKS